VSVSWHRRCEEYKSLFPNLEKYLLPEDVLFDSGAHVAVHFAAEVL
jgi:hypothetical protein